MHISELLKFDATPFYPMSLSPTVEHIVKKEPVYPLLLSLRHELEVFVYNIEKHPSNAVSFFMCDRLGLPQLVLLVGSDGKLNLRKHSAADKADLSDVFETDKLKYAMTRVRKLAKEGTDKDIGLQEIKTRGIETITSVFDDLVTSYVSISPNEARRRFYPGFTANTDRFLLEMYKGLRKFEELPDACRANLDEQARLYDETAKMHMEMRDEIDSAVSGNRFVMRYNRDLSNTWFTLGGVEISNVRQFIAEKYSNDYQDNSNVKTNFTYPFRMYRNLDSLPDDIRDTVQATLNILKLGRTTKQNATHLDRLTPSLPYGSYLAVFNEGSSLCWTRFVDRAGDVWLLLPDKRALLM